ncbi:MAG: hypothetical protein JXR05_15435 [Flavobacteriaceae bacterium]
MEYTQIIKEVTKEILSEEIHYVSLKNKLETLNSTLLNITKIDVNNLDDREDIQFENGIALCPTFAALCVVDLMRTRQFIRGVFKAVKEVRSQKNTPVKVFYAGTGPFATLILPLLTKYSPQELQLTLLEVNEKTGEYLKSTIKELEIESYIEKIISEDASKYKIAKTQEVDILISETMQHGLVKEQQVPIMLNLVNQLSKDVIIIPNNIKLDLALVNTKDEFVLNDDLESRYKFLKTVLEFDKRFIHNHSNQTSNSNRFQLCKQLQFLEEGDDEEYDKLAILTSIQVYDDEWIHSDSCSLTVPRSLLNIERIEKGKKKISLDYTIKNLPDFEYKLN